MLTAAQLMDGSRTLATASKLREEHAKCATIPFDRTMYASAAEKLHGWSMDLERWSRIAAAYDEGHYAQAELQAFSESATRMLAQLQLIKAGAEA